MVGNMHGTTYTTDKVKTHYNDGEHEEEQLINEKNFMRKKK